MKLYVVNSQYLNKPGSNPSFAVRGLVVSQDGKEYRVFERKDAKSGRYVASQFIDASLVENGEMIENGDVLNVEYNANGYIEKCSKIANEKLVITINRKQ